MYNYLNTNINFQNVTNLDIKCRLYFPSIDIHEIQSIILII